MSSRNENPISPKMILSNEAPASAPGAESEGDEEQDESRVPRTKRSPGEPTNDEIRLHEVTHTPYRSWCP